MPTDWHRMGDPDHGYYRIASERPFHYLSPDPDKMLLSWLAPTVTCPLCGATTALVLVYEARVDPAVMIRCPARHEFEEPGIDVAYFRAYCQLRYGLDCDPDYLWILDAGFGEEPPPPDTLQDYAEAAAHIAKTVRREIRSQIRTEKRKAKRSLRQLIGIARNGTDRRTPRQSTKARTGEPGAPKTPSYAAYRKALGIPAPERGGGCLVCSGSGRITAPGVNIPCTQCSGGTGGSETRQTVVNGNGLQVNTGIVNGDITGPDGTTHQVRYVGRQAYIDGAPVPSDDPRLANAAAQMSASAAASLANLPRGGITNNSGVWLNGRRIPEGDYVDERGNHIQNNPG